MTSSVWSPVIFFFQILMKTVNHLCAAAPLSHVMLLAHQKHSGKVLCACQVPKVIFHTSWWHHIRAGWTDFPLSHKSELISRSFWLGNSCVWSPWRQRWGLGVGCQRNREQQWHQRGCEVGRRVCPAKNQALTGVTTLRLLLRGSVCGVWRAEPRGLPVRMLTVSTSVPRRTTGSTHPVLVNHYHYNQCIWSYDVCVCYLSVHLSCSLLHTSGHQQEGPYMRLVQLKVFPDKWKFFAIVGLFF